MSSAQHASAEANSKAGDREENHFTLLSANDLLDLPEPEWLIDGILPSAGLASAYGRSGVGKTFICLDLVAAVAQGAQWFGYATKQTQVVYIAQEGQAGIPRRVRAWAAHHNQAFPEAVKFVFNSFAVTSPKQVAELIKTISENGGAGLVVIDTLNRAAPGSDENSSADMGKILAGASALQQALGGTVLLVHHPGKDVSRGLRGHSSLHAALDTVIEVDRQGELIRWTSVKVKDDKDGAAHLFNLTSIHIGTSGSGKPLTSCVVTPVEGSAALQNYRKPEGKNQQEVFAALSQLLIDQRIQSALTDPDWPNGFPEGLPYDFLMEQIKDTLSETPVKHRRLRTKEALTGLFDNGFLVAKGDLIGFPTR